MVRLNVKKAEGIKDKIIGLIGKDKPIPLLIKTRFGIHTFGMRFPIDVIILDKNMKVVKMKENLKPNEIFFWNPIFDIILELPIGTIEKLKVRVLDKVKLHIS